MIILDKPYVSDFLKESIKKEQFKVLENRFIKEFLSDYTVNSVSGKDAINAILNNQELLYTNSENAINWISHNLMETSYPEKIDIFKNKIKFRELISSLYPNFYFKKIAFTDLDALNYNDLPKPLILKPSIGFFSLGVHLIENENEWKNALGSLKDEMEKAKEAYPIEVMNGKDFIIESYIDGIEYAVDCYFDANGTPVILNILEHQFSSIKDVSDRLYYTSKDIMLKLKDKVQVFLKDLNKLADLKSFPLHIEIRIKEDKIVPIEGNPLRFGGWCTTADLTYYAYGFNPYTYFFEQKKPDWDQIFRENDDSFFSIVILNNTTGCCTNEIKSFEYEKLLAYFENPLELRKIDHKKFSFFGFVFTKTSKENFEELEKILSSNLKEYVTIN